jgi:hypothetical protein
VTTCPVAIAVSLANRLADIIEAKRRARDWTAERGGGLLSPQALQIRGGMPIIWI